MKKPTTYFALLLLVALFASCKDGETYAEQKNKERKAIDAFIQRDIVVRDEDGTVVCNVGKVNPISEEQFLNQDSTTDLSKNEYVLFSNSGIYMQIVRKGVGEKLSRAKRRASSAASWSSTFWATASSSATMSIIGTRVPTS